MSLPNDTPRADRRAFLGKAAAAVVVTTLAPGLILHSFARSPAEPASAARRWGMLIDAAKCARGCDACVQGCGQENGLRQEGAPRQQTRWIRKLELRDRQTGKETSLPMMCQHCEHPPCVDVCPTGASFRRADGVVLVNMHTCIGCRYCMMACPYQARFFEHATVTGQAPHAPRGKGVVSSCTLCVQRIDRDENPFPACAQACRDAGHDAMLFGDLADPNGEIAGRVRDVASRAVRADLGLGTGVRYQGV